MNMNELEGYWYVVREVTTHPAKTPNLKPLSRRMLYQQEALNWMDYCKEEESNCKEEFFIYFRVEPWSDTHKKLMSKE